MKPQTLNDVFSTIVERNHDRVMLVRETNQWVSINSRQFHEQVTGMAQGLTQRGLVHGDRLAILSENRPEWAISDFAAFHLGAVTVPIYATLTAQQTAYILCDSGAKVAVVSTADQLQKVLSIKNQTPLEQIVVMDPMEIPGVTPMRRLIHEGSAESNPELDEKARAVRPDDLASIIYTSGTTGTSKGVKLTHGNLTSNIKCSLEGFDLPPGHVSVSFLPLSHVTARHVDLALLYKGVTLAYCPCFDVLPQTLMEVRPTIFVGVPRVFEKIYAAVEQKAKRFPKRAIYNWALSVGRAHKHKVLAGDQPTSLNWKLANKLLFSQIRTRMGGNVEIFVSGGAPLGFELADWFATVGIRIHEGYGLTETSPVIAVNNPRNHKLGTVGRPLSNLEIRIADDSEILVRGPSVFRSYWNRPDETSKSFIDGWFKTGDIGHLDNEGFLSVTDRKKDLLKTSGGKFIAPQPIENSLKLNALIGTAVVVGDRRKFATVIISPCFPMLEEWARANGISFSSRQELVSDPRVQKLYEDIVAEVNQNLARYETLKKVLLVPEEFTADDGSLTPTLKLRRKVVEERYHEQIDELYEEAEALTA
ncbi:MAG TPA: long-chain fatty acid--CoA ligase [Terriglobales bacterium]|nr:long-chain fatty acid--CoA ligase [Terriglobales bacterium]